VVVRTRQSTTDKNAYHQKLNINDLVTLVALSLPLNYLLAGFLSIRWMAVETLLIDGVISWTLEYWYARDVSLARMAL
jgi:hypothetical protein